ncbi:MAG: tRNA threonylcarbamoyladenosine dehydratase [Bacteroidales bacterium]|jgi:tRNA A37 threonylcarbamoyladenosine dehydratase|nr:tRNA threonylcarbamoyladenosine dehydratase [Bacteroidales bacterium]MCI2122491.1 tRNA threonylcarbamoyladenosine dehydratase [Bacteroidales bacterium]MCI2145480.1 tRNA threonylcarbamoyladenosine dehydratase [Bacteroidales bacterium]
MGDWRERTEMLVGGEGLRRLNEAHVAVIGLGGVGSFAAEMICRAGVGHLILLDSDIVGMSNKNRQLIALDSTLECKKTEVMAERLRDVNPGVELVLIEDFLTKDNVPSILGKHKIDFLVDAIDTLTPKIALISYCLDKNVRMVSSMGAGAKFDATKIKLADISESRNCPLAHMLRKRLRNIGIVRGFDVVYSEELPDRNAIVTLAPFEERNKKSQVGTLSYLPATFGCVCAQAAITYLLNPAEHDMK